MSFINDGLYKDIQNFLTPRTDRQNCVFIVRMGGWSVHCVECSVCSPNKLHLLLKERWCIALAYFNWKQYHITNYKNFTNYQNRMCVKILKI